MVWAACAVMALGVVIGGLGLASSRDSVPRALFAAFCALVVIGAGLTLWALA